MVSVKARVGLSPLAASLCRELGLRTVSRAPSSPAAAHPVGHLGAPPGLAFS